MSQTTLPFAYQSFPPDERGVIRARTDNQLRLIDIPRDIIREVIEEHFGKLNFSGIYLLLHHTKKKVYVGQASNIRERIELTKNKKSIQHIDGKIVELRPTMLRSDKGSKKKQGWQITARGSFKKLVDGKKDGYFVYARGKGLVFSFKELNEIIGDRTRFDTTDLYFKFTPDDKVFLHLAGAEDIKDVTIFTLPEIVGTE